MNYGLERMRKLGIEPSEIRLTGGGSKNRAWRRIAADVFGVDVVCPMVEESAAYGAALQALWTYLNYVGEKVTIQELTDRFVKLDEATRVKPEAGNVERYRRLQELHNHLSVRLRGVFRLHRAYLNDYV